jgi:hypothetical protein
VALADDEPEPSTEPLTSLLETPGAKPNPSPAPPPSSAFSPAFSKSRYRFTSGLRAGELARIRDDAGTALLTYRSFASVVGIVAALVSGIVLLAGFAATAFLIAEKSPLRAVIVFALTLVFSLVITLLVPRVEVTLYEGDQPALTISQNFVFPTASFVVATASGTTLATLRRSAFSRLGRNRWTIVTDGHVMGHAVEESFRRSFTRKFLGKFHHRFDANVRIEYSGLDAGTILRRGAEADTLEIRGDQIDRRVAIALATLILGSEP